MTRYVVGFRFTNGKVVLIKKNRPKWQKNLLNGVGGHVEPTESATKAMVREFHEETGFKVENWSHFCTLKGHKLKVFCYRSFGPFDGYSATDEEIVTVPVDRLPYNIISNLQWLIPMALDDSYTVGEVTI